MVICPNCKEDWYAEFDVTFVEVWGTCLECTDEAVIDKMAEVVFDKLHKGKPLTK